jgi:hypothetical protein
LGRSETWLYNYTSSRRPLPDGSEFLCAPPGGGAIAAGNQRLKDFSGFSQTSECRLRQVKRTLVLFRRDLTEKPAKPLGSGLVSKQICNTLSAHGHGGFGRLIFDSSPTVIAKDASSSNEMSTSHFQDWSVVNSNSAASCTAKSRPDRVTFSANAGQFFGD